MTDEQTLRDKFNSEKAQWEVSPATAQGFIMVLLGENYPKEARRFIEQKTQEQFARIAELQAEFHDEPNNQAIYDELTEKLPPLCKEFVELVEKYKDGSVPVPTSE